MEVIVFYIFGIIAVVSAVLVITQKNTIYSALSLIATLFSVAVLFLLLEAQFVAAVQVLVYAGAIMILFLFAIMLLNVKYAEKAFSALRGMKVVSIIIAGILFLEFIYIIFMHKAGGLPDKITPEQAGNVEMIGKMLFTKYLLPFEIASLVLLVAMVGVIVLAKRRHAARPPF